MDDASLASEEPEARKITARIQRIEQARMLADRGRFDEALALLRRVREAYDEAGRRKVDWLIADLERRGAEAGPGP